MTRPETVGQCFMLGFAGTSVSRDLADLLARYRPGGIILFSRNLETPAQIVRLTNDLQKLSPQTPLLISVDQEGGRVSRLPDGFTLFPPSSVFGQCDSSGLAYAAASAIAVELRAVGINMNLAPVLDLNTNPQNPIIGDRAFSANPMQVCELGLATIAGLQDNKVIACGKHFPGHGDTATDSHKELPVVSASMERLREVELRPFRHAIGNNLATIMSAHVLYPALDARFPATLSAAILTDLLRDDLRFKGLALTDDLEMHAILDHYSIEAAAIRALNAGADILLVCKDPERQAAAMNAVYRAVKDGDIPDLRFEHAVLRVLEAKERYLLPYTSADPKHAAERVGTKAHREVAHSIKEAAEQASV